MYILTDGKNYVMENPLKSGEYLQTTYSVEAKEFTYKQAKGLLTKHKGQKYDWIKNQNFQMVNQATGEVENDIRHYSNEDVFCGDREYTFDDNILAEVNTEVNAILALGAWNTEKLNEFIGLLNQGLSFYDSAISDVRHARMDSAPPANVMTKIDKMRNSLEEKRRDIKQTKNYIETMLFAIEQRWTLEKLRLELQNAKYVPYKGRTKYFDEAMELLKDYKKDKTEIN